MADEKQMLWRSVLEMLRGKYSEVTIRLWFEPTEIDSIDGKHVILVTDTDWKRSILSEKYINVLEGMFSDVLGYDVTVSFISKEQKDSPDNSEISLFRKTSVPRNTTKEPVVPNVDPMLYERIKDDYTFDTFVVGSSNRVAHAASVAVTGKPAEIYNPLFIYGPSGIGKTHLLFAVINEYVKKFPDYRIIYVTCEEFANELIEAISNRKTLAFREKYRNADLLLVDDVQFIAGKSTMQEEFFHTFDTLLKFNKQVVFTSDKPPKDIALLEDRLRTRFEMGLIADIQPPDEELRMAIFKKKAEKLGITLPPDVLNYLSSNIKSNIRLIEGAIKRLWAQSFITGNQINLRFATETLKDFFKEDEKTITIDKIIAYCSKKYGCKVEELKGKKRLQEIVYVRHIAIYLITELTEMSLKSIGKYFDRDHTTIINARDNVIERMKNEEAFSNEVNSLLNEIKEL